MGIPMSFLDFSKKNLKPGYSEHTKRHMLWDPLVISSLWEPSHAFQKQVN